MITLFIVPLVLIVIGLAILLLAIGLCRSSAAREKAWEELMDRQEKERVVNLDDVRKRKEMPMKK